MKRDAEAHAAEDKKRRDVVDLKNRADAFVIQTRKSLEEHGGKVSPESRGQIESAISSLETALKGEDKDAIERSMKELERVGMELGKAVYEAEAAKQKAAAGPTDAGAGNGGGKKGGKDDVIDAEFEVKDDKK
jgi:molecular chaperone DnaK